MTAEKEIRLADVVVKSFHDFWKACREPYTYYVCKGGRNSAKSTTIAQRLIFDVMDLPLNTLVLRKVHNTIRESVYEQLKEAANQLDVAELFDFGVSPMRVIYKPRGNGFLFRGADDPQKIKSIKTADFPLARIWVEELAEFKTREELDVITDSVLRGELPNDMRYKVFYSYNPPRRKAHWANKEFESVNIPANTYVHHSSYKDNPFLSQQALEQVENYRITQGETKYRWYYLGDPCGGGVVPFDNLVFRKITTEEIEHFDNIRQGLDFGYAVDPLAFVKSHYDKKHRKLYLLDEIYGVKMSNREFAEAFKAKKFTREIICDSAEPKSIAELETHGLKVTGARKGEGSVEYGEEWLDDLAEIVIDPQRTPNAAREFENIDYQVERDGSLKTGRKAKLEDKNNHTIDATRYACEDEMTEPVSVEIF